MAKVTFEEIAARGGVQHAPARSRFPRLPLMLGVLSGLILGAIPAGLILGGPS